MPINAHNWLGWLGPVVPWHVRLPIISQEFRDGNRYLPNGKLDYRNHLGVDIMFAWQVGDPMGPIDTVAKSKGGIPKFIAPIGTEIRAAGPGKIWNAGIGSLGRFIQIDHGKVGSDGVNTFYQHLDSFARPWRKGDLVNAGDILGTMGGDPSNFPHLRHLHFELWFPQKGLKTGQWPRDPVPYMALWSHS